MITKSMALTVLSLCVAIGTLCAACVGAPQFTEVQGKEWKLKEIRTDPGETLFDRRELQSEGFGDNLFTLKFEGDRMAGMAAPNRYFGPYEAGQGYDLTIKNIAGTLMAPFREPEKLKEHEYFIYLQNTYRWNVSNGNLELFTKDEDGREAVMFFVNTPE
ncbi:hypothetical protein AGMMS50255_1540 [Spirochaetia bacterium]|nr:hypothetical protein AGMMS50255_1540 [Spirochaetia bacterium]